VAHSFVARISDRPFDPVGQTLPEVLHPQFTPTALLIVAPFSALNPWLV